MSIPSLRALVPLWLTSYLFLANLSSPAYGVPIDADLFRVYTRALELKGEKQYSKSQDLLKQIIEKDPNFVRAYYQLVKVSKAQNDLESVETYFTTLLKNNGRNAFVYFGLAVVREEEYAQGKHQTDEGLVHYRRALESNPFEPMIYIRFGDMSQRLRQLDRAEDLVKRLVREYPQTAATHFGRAYICQLQTKWDEALHHLQEALTLNPRMLNAYYAKGHIYSFTGRAEEALHIFERGEKLAEEINDLEHMGDFKRGRGLT